MFSACNVDLIRVKDTNAARQGFFTYMICFPFSDKRRRSSDKTQGWLDKRNENYCYN